MVILGVRSSWHISQHGCMTETQIIMSILSYIHFVTKTPSPAAHGFCSPVSLVDRGTATQRLALCLPLCQFRPADRSKDSVLRIYLWGLNTSLHRCTLTQPRSSFHAPSTFGAAGVSFLTPSLSHHATINARLSRTRERNARLQLASFWPRQHGGPYRPGYER